MCDRAGHVARTVWALLDAASKHGLDVLVPEERPLLLHPVKATATNRAPGHPSHPDARGKARASEVGRKGRGGAIAVGAAVPARQKDGAVGGGEERAGTVQEVDGSDGARENGEAGEKGDESDESGGGGMDLCPEEVTKFKLGHGRSDAAGDGGGSAGMESRRGVGDDGADVLSAGSHSEARSKLPDESALGSVGAAGSFESGDSSMDDTGSSWTENGATTRVAPPPEVVAVAVTTRSGGKRHMSASVAEEEQQIAPPPPLVAGEGGETSALPPKPKMSQVTYCGILPVYTLSARLNPYRAGTAIGDELLVGRFRRSDSIVPCLVCLGV